MNNLKANIEVCILESKNNQEINFNTPYNGINIEETKYVELQKEIEVINDQFKNVVRQKHELMLHNETLSNKLYKAEIR